MKLFHWVARLLRIGQHDASLAEEIEQHRQHIQQDLEADGLSREDAAAASRRAMGNVTLAREESREVWALRWLDRLSRDVRHAARGLRREPVFALTAILTLSLGLATTTTVFSVVDAELWRPLPFRASHELLAAVSRGPGTRAPVDGLSPDDLAAWRTGVPAFEGIAAEARTLRRVLRRATADSVLITEVTSNYFTVLGHRVVLGRAFTEFDPEATRDVVLTEAAWRRLYDADRAVVGDVVSLDGEPFRIVGVVSDDRAIPPNPDFFIRLDEPRAGAPDDAPPVFYGAIGRLALGMSATMAEAQLRDVLARMARDDAERWTGHAIHVEGLREYFSGNNWRPLYMFLSAAVVVLLLGAVNVAALLLARTVRRSREFALRGALGGGQGTLARQLAVEAALLALPAGALGLLLSTWAVSIFTNNLPTDALLRGGDIPVDLRAGLFAFGATALTTLLFALTPLVTARRLDLSGALGPGGRTSRTAADGKARLVLLTVQLGLTVVLLSGAGLFLKSFQALTNVPLGFDPDGTISLRATLSGPQYDTDEQIQSYAERLLEVARATPGVDEAAIGSSSPLGSGPMVNFVDPDRPAAPGEEPRAIIRAASPGFFRALGIPMLRGREFVADDAAGAERVAVVNEHLAREMFGDTNPVGRLINLLPARAPWTNRPGTLLIVGVASNIKEIGLNEVQFADIYVPFAQMPSPSMELLVHSELPPGRLAETLRAEVSLVDPAIPVRGVSTFDQRVSDALQQDRFNLLLVGSFAVVAVLLAGIGVYGAVAYDVQARTREFGVRLALGARPARLVGLALSSAGRLGVIGGLAGLAVTVVGARALGNALYLVPGSHNGLLFGVSTSDPVVLGGAFLGMVAIALLAGAIPARRVARVDPMLALRND